jgi:death-on-curing protein
VWGKAAALMHSLLANHPFVDGNKRTGLAATGIFLELNGWSLTASNDDAAEFVNRVIVERLSVDEIAAWLCAHCEAGEGQ